MAVYISEQKETQKNPVDKEFHRVYPNDTHKKSVFRQSIVDVYEFFSFK